MVAILTKYFSKIFSFKFHISWTILSIPQINYYLHNSSSYYFFTNKVVQFIDYYHYWEDSLTSKVYVSHPNCNNKLILVLSTISKSRNLSKIFLAKNFKK